MSNIQPGRSFEDYMSAGLREHANGNHRDALILREQAFWSSNNTIEQARALRDGAASHGYLGEFALAEEAASSSVDLLLETGDDRELGASYDRLGRVRTLQNMHAEQSGSHVLDPSRAVFDKAKELLSTEDQYYINMIGRSATSSALYGNRGTALIDSLRALKASIKSETRKKHFVVAVSSLMITALLKNPTDSGRVHTRAFRLAEKVML